MSSKEDDTEEVNKKTFTMDETVHFDPTSIGLPSGWSLTDWSDLKG